MEPGLKGRKGEYQRTILVFASDQQCGSSFGLMPPDWQSVDDYKIVASPAQKIIYDKGWINSWKQVEKLRNKDTRIIFINVGDATDGYHHNTKQLTTDYVNEHESMFMQCLDRAFDVIDYNTDKGDASIFVAGTSVHVGENGASEDRIARRVDDNYGGVIRAAPGTTDYDGRFVWQRFLGDFNGIKYDIAHTATTIGARVWLRGNNMRYYLKDMYWGCMESGIQAPDYVVRAHRHIHIIETIHEKNATITGMVLPCLQLKTDFVYKLPLSLHHIPSVGICWFVLNDNVKFDTNILEMPQERYVTV